MLEFGKIVSTLTDVHKIPTVVLWALIATAASLLFLPDALLASLHLADVRRSYGPFVGIVFLLTSILVVAKAASWISNRWNRGKVQRTAQNRTLLAIHDVDHAERSVLREFVLQGKHTIRAPIDNPVVAGLLQKGIVEQVGSIGQRMLCGLVFSIRVGDFAKPFVHAGFLDLPENPSERQREQIINDRPDFVADIEGMERMLSGPIRRRGF